MEEVILWADEKLIFLLYPTDVNVMKKIVKKMQNGYLKYQVAGLMQTNVHLVKCWEKPFLFFQHFKVLINPNWAPLCPTWLHLDQKFIPFHFYIPCLYPLDLTWLTQRFFVVKYNANFVQIDIYRTSTVTLRYTFSSSSNMGVNVNLLDIIQSGLNLLNKSAHNCIPKS